MSQATRLRYEAWTLPWSGDFHRVIASMPVIEGSGNGSTSFNAAAGDGSVDVDSATFKRLGAVIDANSGTLIRVFDGTNIIHEWLAERNSQTHEESQLVTISGPSLQAALDKWVVYPYDYPDNPSLDPDWNWGSGGQNLLENPSFENPALPNGGFEDGNTGHWSKTDNDGFIGKPAEFHVVQNASEAQAGEWYGVVTPDGTNTGIMRSIGDLQPGEVYTIIGYAKEDTASGQRMRAGISGASKATHTNAYTANGVFWWAELDNAASGGGASDGTWQQFTLTFKAASTTCDLVVLYTGGGTGLVFSVDSFTIEGYGVGLDPWEPHPDYSTTDVFEIEDVSPIQEGFQSCHFRGNARPNALYQKFDHPGIVQDVSVEVGKTYTLEGWVRHASGSDERVGLSLRRRSQIQTFADYSDSILFRNGMDIPTATWTQVRATGVSEVTAARFRFNWIYTGAFDTNYHQSPHLYFDNCYLYEGFPPATPGEILKILLDDAAIDHATDPRGVVLTWIAYGSFGVNLDSNNNAWDSEISFSVPMGTTYGQVLDNFADLGYEWELVPIADPDPAGPTHRLHLYNPDGRDDAPETAINPRQGVTGGEAIYRQPDYTATLVEGSSGSFVESVSATINNFGRTEKFVASRNTGADTLAKVASSVLKSERVNRIAARFDIVATRSHPHPLVDYRPGDTLWMQLPPLLARESRRVERIDYVNSSPTTYVVVGSKILVGEAGGWELVRKMWRRFQRRQKKFKGAGGGAGGGQPTIVIAPSNASADSMRKADVFATGAGDEAAYIEAIARCLTTDGSTWGKIQVTEGTLNITAGLWVPLGIIFQGMAGGTRIEADTPTGTWAVEVEDGTPPAVFRDMVVNNVTGSGARILGIQPD